MKQKEQKNLCACGCGNIAPLGKHYCWGHRLKVVAVCACGCGQSVSPGRTYVWGHNGRINTPKQEEVLCPQCGNYFARSIYSDTIHCSSQCYGKTKKGQTLTDAQIQGYKNRVLPEPWNKGLTKENSTKVKELFSEPRKGVGNPMYGYVYSDEYKKQMSNQCKGRKLSLSQRKKLSEAAAKRTQENKNNCIKSFKRGRVTLDRLGITAYYASSFELQAFLLLDSYANVLNVSTQPIRIPYVWDDGSSHYYVPDLLVTLNTGESYLIEIKPKSLMRKRLNQLKFCAGNVFASKHNMVYLIWTEDVLFNKNGVTTELTKETLSATAAVLCNERTMIQSELYSDIERQAEMTCPPIINIGQQVTECNLESELTKYLGGEVEMGLASLATAAL